MVGESGVDIPLLTRGTCANTLLTLPSKHHWCTGGSPTELPRLWGWQSGDEVSSLQPSQFWFPQPLPVAQLRPSMRFTHILAAALVALGMSLTADEIPKGTSKTSPDAATCGLPYDPFPYLRNCSSPIDKGLPDLRGTWEAPLAGGLRTYQERVEQCEDRFTVTGKSSKSGLYFIHDFKHADGTLANFYNVASFPDCVRETVFGNMSANCMYMWHVANNGTEQALWQGSECSVFLRVCRFRDVQGFGVGGHPYLSR